MEYSELPERAKKVLETFFPDEAAIAKRAEHFKDTPPRSPDTDGSTEALDGVSFEHHFRSTAGDYETVSWHYVTCGDPCGKPIVFLHGIPDSWYQWHHQMAALSATNFCIGVDLKGYGQSSKEPGTYVHEAVAEQLYTLLMEILPPPKKCFLVGHDRGTVQADFLCAKYPDFVLGYGRGEQHLYHFNPVLAPQHAIFMDAPYSGMMEDAKKFVPFVYTWITKKPIPDNEMERVIQEFSYPQVSRAVPRYFMSGNFRQEWLARRQGGWKRADGTTAQSGMLAAWRCPVVIMQGYDSKTQPREFYEKAREYIPNAAAVEVTYMSGGHFWTLESPAETTQAIQRLIILASQ